MTHDQIIPAINDWLSRNAEVEISTLAEDTGFSAVGRQAARDELDDVSGHIFTLANRKIFERVTVSYRFSSQAFLDYSIKARPCRSAGGDGESLELRGRCLIVACRLFVLRYARPDQLGGALPCLDIDNIARTVLEFYRSSL